MLNWTNIKVNIPGVGERAYVVQIINPPSPPYTPFIGYACEQYQGNGCYFLGPGSNYTVSTVNPAYNTTNPSTGGIFTLLQTYPAVGDYVSMGFVAGAGSNPTAITSRHCLKVVAIISEADYLNGWCNACDVNSTFCPDPPGCAYSLGTFTSGVGPLAYNYINTNLNLEYNGYTNDIRIDSNCVDCHYLPVTTSGPDCDDCDELDLIDAGMSGSVMYNGVWQAPTSVIGVPPAVAGLTDCAWRGFNAVGNMCGVCAYSASTSTVTPSNYIDLHVWWEWMSINHPTYNKGPVVGNTIPLATFLTDIMVLPMSGYNQSPPQCCSTPGYWDFNMGDGPCDCSHSCCPGQTATIKTAWIGEPFILKERYIQNGSLNTNTLAKGSWSTVLSWLWANGMPNTIFTYAPARTWFTDITNLTSVLKIWTDPTCTLSTGTPACCNRWSDNDVFMEWYILNGKCDQPIPGCTDNVTPALNYNPLATVNCDGTPIGTYGLGWSACCVYNTTACGHAVCWNCNGSTCYVDPTGPYSSQTQCLTGLPPVPGNPYPYGCDPCECVPIPGTGHTGAYHYTAQTICELICCNGFNIDKCDVLIIGPNEGILYYDLQTNSTLHLFNDPGAENFDISATETDIWTIKNTTGGGNFVNNHVITTNPFTHAPSGGVLAAGNVMGRGLCYYDNLHHLTATDWVKVVNINTGTPTNWFQLPDNMKCTGDLLWGGTAIGTGGAGLLVILMNGTPTGGIPTSKVAKFTASGILVEEYIIPPTILTGTTSFDSLFVDADNDEIYGITTDGRVYHLEQNPVFQFAPLPTAQIPLQSSTGEIKGATNIENNAWNGEMTCATHAIKIPVTFNCDFGTQSCLDPGNGTGTFTGINAYTLCQAACVFSYNCDPGTGVGNCATASYQLPWPTINNSMAALHWIVDPANGLNNNPFDAHTYETPLSVPNGCISNGHQTFKLVYIQCPTIGPNPFYYWQQFITACVMIHGIPVNMSMTCQTVRNAVNNHFGFYVSISAVPEACICYGSPCHCDPVLGATTGTYPDNWTCVQNCCGAVPCVKCCKDQQGNTYPLPSWLYPCECPAGHTEVWCGPVPIPLISDDPQSKCKIGQMFSYELDRCVCQRPYPCAPDNIWNDETCTCIPIYAQSTQAIIEVKHAVIEEEKKKEKEKTVIDGVNVEDTYGTTVTDSVQYYACAAATNSIVGETQRACIPQDSNTPGSYSSLADCLNSGCAGFMKCEPGQSVNGVMMEGEEFYTPIVMCCESVISTQMSTGPYEYTVSGPLTVAMCSSDCGNGQTWFPLYNATGPNTVHDSPLAYMIRELELQLAIHQCSVTTNEEDWIKLGYRKQNIY